MGDLLGGGGGKEGGGGGNSPLFSFLFSPFNIHIPPTIIITPQSLRNRRHDADPSSIPALDTDDDLRPTQLSAPPRHCPS